MGHAEHFLSRLERVATREVDLALQLYRDPELMRVILASVATPEAVGRVAISLDDPVEGPFIIVTRDGHFVTCLGRGMRVGGLFVVTRGQLDALSEKVANLRERMALADRLAGHRERPCAHLLRRLVVASDSVSREEWMAVSAWEPMLQPVFLDLYLAMGTEILEQAPLLRRLRTDKPRVSARDEALLHDYWETVHAAGHLILLATMGGDREQLLARTDSLLPARSALSFALTSTAMIPFIAKGAWAVGRIGKPLLPAYKKALAEDVAFFELMDTVFALLAIGRRTAGLRAEIAKALRAAAGTATTPQAIRLRDVMRKSIESCCALAVEYLETAEEELDETMVINGARLMALHAGKEEPFTDVPPDILRAFVLRSYLDGLTSAKSLAMGIAIVAAAARGAPEQFYLPHDLSQAAHVRWEPAHTLRLLAPMAEVVAGTRRPAVRSEHPGPNEPCSCGSGRKYKKCCARG